MFRCRELAERVTQRFGQPPRAFLQLLTLGRFWEGLEEHREKCCVRNLTGSWRFNYYSIGHRWILRASVHFGRVQQTRYTSTPYEPGVSKDLLGVLHIWDCKKPMDGCFS